MANDSYSGVAVGLLPKPFDKATNRSKEMSALVNTKLKVYELPDWQLLQSQLEITQ